MTKTRSRSSVVALVVMTAVGIALCGGCAPIDSGELDLFVKELLLNAVAAFFS